MGLNRDKVFQYGQMFEKELRKSGDFKGVQSDIKTESSPGSVGPQYIENSSFYDVIIELADEIIVELQKIFQHSTLNHQ